jgi:tetratricopeptide (TPR) repeat protein
LLLSSNRDGEAERVYRRSIEVTEVLRLAYVESVELGINLVMALNDLARLLLRNGELVEAEDVYRRAVGVGKALWTAHPSNLSIYPALGLALNELGGLLRDTGELNEAENVYRSAVDIGIASVAMHNGIHVYLHAVGVALNNLGTLLCHDGRLEEAERAYARAIEYYENMWRVHPDKQSVGDGEDKVDIGGGLGLALRNMGSLLRNTNQLQGAERLYRRSIKIYEKIWRANPESGIRLGEVLTDLGDLMRSDGRQMGAEHVYRRSIKLYRSIWRANPHSVECGLGLSMTLIKLSNLMIRSQAYGPVLIYNSRVDEAVRRCDEAEQTVSAVLNLVPNHPSAIQLKQFITNQYQSSLIVLRPGQVPWWQRWFGGGT